VRKHHFILTPFESFSPSSDQLPPTVIAMVPIVKELEVFSGGFFFFGIAYALLSSNDCTAGQEREYTPLFVVRAFQTPPNYFQIGFKA
jgi:hypothetical protein